MLPSPGACRSFRLMPFVPRSQMTLVKPAPLTVPGVFASLHALADASGRGSKARRQGTVLGLLRAARESEPKYLVRTLVQVCCAACASG